MVHSKLAIGILFLLPANVIYLLFCSLKIYQVFHYSPSFLSLYPRNTIPGYVYMRKNP